MTNAPETLDRLNALSGAECVAALRRVCGSERWAGSLAALRPFATLEHLHAKADEVWWSLSGEDWNEAFSHHPRIGSRDALKEKFASTRTWAQGEQARVESGAEATIEGLLQGNEEHEKRFGYIFIVCATGKSAEEMLAILRLRLANDAATELRASACEENRITHIRLAKLLAPAAPPAPGHITTHVLDTALGKPAAGVAMRLERLLGDRWETIGAGSTDADGRLKTLYPAGEPLCAASYQLTFETGAYLAGLGLPSFFPYVRIVFAVPDGASHYHVPLLLSPFGYSTYRGS